MTTIRVTSRNAAGVAVPGARVVVRLVAGPRPTDPGYFTTGDYSITSESRTVTGSTGLKVLTLPPTDGFSPDGCFYQSSTVIGADVAKRTITVPATGTYDWGDPAIQVLTPVPPEWVSVANDTALLHCGVLLEFDVTATWFAATASLVAVGDRAVVPHEDIADPLPDGPGLYESDGTVWVKVADLFDAAPTENEYHLRLADVRSVILNESFDNEPGGIFRVVYADLDPASSAASITFHSDAETGVLADTTNVAEALSALAAAIDAL